jgi:peptidyl-tRNA hydrolase
VFLNSFEEFLEDELDEFAKIDIGSLTSVRDVRVVQYTLEEFEHSRLQLEKESFRQFPHACRLAQEGEKNAHLVEETF